MKISIITAVYNNAEHIEGCIKSVLSQGYDDIEYIIIDGASTDGTLEIINKYREKISQIISEEDAGQYYAFNKGIRAATGDIVAILNSDDIYADDNVVSDVVKLFRDNDADCVYGDLVYVGRIKTDKIRRYWRSGKGDRAKIYNGWMPAHPTLFIKRDIYETFGYYNTDYKISSDYELIIRFLYMHRISMNYAHRLFIKMRSGRVSNKNLSCVIAKTKEDHRICRVYGLKNAFWTIMKKNLRKIPQFFRRPV